VIGTQAEHRDDDSDERGAIWIMVNVFSNDFVRLILLGVRATIMVPVCSQISKLCFMRQENRTFMSLQLVVFCEIIMSIVAPVALMIHFSSSCQKHYLDVSPGAKEELEAGNIFYSDMWQDKCARQIMTVYQMPWLYSILADTFLWPLMMYKNSILNLSKLRNVVLEQYQYIERNIIQWETEKKAEEEAAAAAKATKKATTPWERERLAILERKLLHYAGILRRSSVEPETEVLEEPDVEPEPFKLETDFSQEVMLTESDAEPELLKQEVEAQEQAQLFEEQLEEMDRAHTLRIETSNIVYKLIIYQCVCGFMLPGVSMVCTLCALFQVVQHKHFYETPACFAISGSPISLYASLLVLHIFVVMAWHDMYLENFLIVALVPLVTLMICATCKLGKQRKGDTKKEFDRYDRNGDGVLDAEELAARVPSDREHWVQTDKNWPKIELDLELAGTMLDHSLCTNKGTENELDLELAGTVLDQRYEATKMDAEQDKNDDQRVRSSIECFAEAALAVSDTIDRRSRTCGNSSRSCSNRPAPRAPCKN